MNSRMNTVAESGFQIPFIYQCMFASGLLDSTHKNYLSLSETEWFSTDRILSSAPMEQRDGLLIPFAVSPSGDRWCWRLESEIEGEPPVVLRLKHINDAIPFAPSFSGCVYRLIIEDLYASKLPLRRAPASESLPELYQRHAENLLPFIPFAWADAIWRIACRPIVVRNDGVMSFLTSAEARYLLERDLEISAPLRFQHDSIEGTWHSAKQAISA